MRRVGDIVTNIQNTGKADYSFVFEYITDISRAHDRFYPFVHWTCSEHNINLDMDMCSRSLIYSFRKQIWRLSHNGLKSMAISMSVTKLGGLCTRAVRYCPFCNLLFGCISRH